MKALVKENEEFQLVKRGFWYLTILGYLAYMAYLGIIAFKWRKQCLAYFKKQMSKRITGGLKLE